METLDVRERVRFLLERGILVTPPMLEAIRSGESVEAIAGRATDGGLSMAPQVMKPIANSRGSVKILVSDHSPPKKREVQDFVSYFNARFRLMERLLRNRAELSGAISINRILLRREKEQVATIGMLYDHQETKSGNLMLTIEDPTGQIRVVVNKSKPELFAQAKALMEDETIGVVGTSADKIIFANQLLWPDVPLNRETRRCPTPGYALFLSDLHVGSKQFLDDKFQRFLQWINGDSGSEHQRQVARETKYIFLIGDLVDGVGIYPEQDKDLAIPDIYDQYRECARLLSLIPRHISLIACPGNHDAVRLAEPQPPFSHEFAKPLWDMPNLTIVSNPAWLNIHASDGFPGLDVLLYHGYSFDHYVAQSDTLRAQGGYDRPDAIMKFLMTRRHLAPTHTSTLYVPGDEDPLVIEKIPDVFLTGHIHKCSALNYRGITMVCGSCWQAKTAFQVKVGHNPEPGRVPYLNLQTRDIKILRF